MLADSIRTVYELDLPTPPNEPTLRGYYGARDSPAEQTRWRRYYTDALRWARVDPAGLDTLEVGSGLGFNLLLFADLGARPHGVELVPWQVEYVQRYLPHLPQVEVDVRQGRAEALPFEDGSMDLVMANEAISHYLDYRPFLAEANRVLRPGGTLLITDGNNGRSRKIRRRNEAMWASHEGDYEGFPDDSPWKLRERRERIITEAFPDLNGEASDLAARTAGMVEHEIVAAVGDYLRTGTKPESYWLPGTVTVFPDHDGMVLERLFDPYELAHELREAGFRPRVRGHWGGAGGRRLIRAADAVLGALSRVTMPTSPAFWIAARKRPLA